ncbi:aspartyl protease family protein [Pedobacter sp.]|uniref:aspartyl protease family protein n=1 Tax=Pedobacter sp. TaxID=1411316 RepID=UPI003D7F7348
MEIWASPLAYGQYFVFDGDRKKETMSFTLIKNLIIVPLYINGKGPFNFILDTGVNPLIITDVSMIDSLQLQGLRSTKLSGLGAGNDIEAYLSDQIDVRFGNASMSNMPTAILKTDLFNLSDYVGQRIYGLIGFHFFNSFTVRIRYPSKKLTYSLPDVQVKKKGERIPLEMINNKPYVQLWISSDKEEDIEVKMIMDIGASHAVSMESYEGKPFPLPEKHIKANLGVGFAGLISGWIGRLNSVTVGSKTFKDVLTSFPEFSQAGAKTGVPVRNGNLGNNLLKHFDLTIDYAANAMYLKPNSFMKATFEHDMSGMEVYVKHGSPDAYFIGRIEPGSPAENAGILTNDQLLSLNFKPIEDYNLDDIDQMLKSGDGKRMILQLVRENTLVFKILVLKRRI